MDIQAFGENPRSPAGCHFGLSARAFIPLAAYCSTTELGYGLSIDWRQPGGFRITNNQAVELAARLQAEIDSGDTAEYERRRDIFTRSHPEDNRNAYYIFSTEIAAEFAGFLRDCGGCRVMY
jgi:hypothetical protein